MFSLCRVQHDPCDLISNYIQILFTNSIFIFSLRKLLYVGKTYIFFCDRSNIFQVPPLDHVVNIFFVNDKKVFFCIYCGSMEFNLSPFLVVRQLNKPLFFVWLPVCLLESILNKKTYNELTCLFLNKLF